MLFERLDVKAHVAIVICKMKNNVSENKLEEYGKQFANILLELVKLQTHPVDMQIHHECMQRCQEVEANLQANIDVLTTRTASLEDELASRPVMGPPGPRGLEGKEGPAGTRGEKGEKGDRAKGAKKR